MSSDFVVMIWACPRPPCGGSVTPANSGSVLVTGIIPTLGCHHFLSPAFMSYAVMPPYSFGFTIDTPPIAARLPRPSKPPPRLPSAGGLYPAGGGRAPMSPQLSRGELYLNSEHGSFCSRIELIPVCEPT